jgi:uncharacterized protein (DUF58 family)
VTLIVLLFILSFSWPILFPLISTLPFLLVALTLADILLLYRNSKGIRGSRITPERLSNGDENKLEIYLENFYPLTVHTEVIDEIPHQFQKRDIRFKASLNPGEVKIIEYFLRPVKRGVYNFGSVNVYVISQLGLVSRRYRFSQNRDVPVYPSFLQLRKYELLAISNYLTEIGIKKIRKIGHNMEFEQIRDYVVGDDFRTINWKATARKSHLMVNNYQDEKSQQVYSLVDKGRVMKMPFNGLSLLDYAINASLVISNTALKKDDKAGIITFQHKIGSILPASRRNNQMHHILELLYNQKTAYKESDFSNLYTIIRRKITQRSLLLLFTNFESVSSMERQLPYLTRMAKDHLLVTIFFINTELDDLLRSPARDIQQVYHKIIAEKFSYEKKLIVKQLNSHGIHTILTEPESLTVNTINKYLELKARGLI